MNLAVRPATLPLWLPIWLVALLLLANLGLLRKPAQDVTVVRAVELHQGRNAAEIFGCVYFLNRLMG